MAEKIYKGKDLRIKVNNQIIFHATECSFTTSRNFEEIESKDTEGVITTSGNYTWGLSSSSLVANIDNANNATQASTLELVNLFKNNQEVAVEFSTFVAGDIIISGNAFVENIEMNAPTTGRATASASFKGNGDFDAAAYA